MVKKIDNAPSPSFSGKFEERLRAYGKGLMIIRSDQCPYVDAALKAALDTTKELGIRAKVIELKSSEDLEIVSFSL